jgi:hypothetical protein
MKAGMKHLIESFYGSIRGDGPEPISHREILLTARIMDQIFAQLKHAQLQHPQSSNLSSVDDLVVR